MGEELKKEQKLEQSLAKDKIVAYEARLKQIDPSLVKLASEKEMRNKNFIKKLKKKPKNGKLVHMFTWRS